MALTAGRKLGPYEILSPIGAGGMGEVYRARDTRLDRDVAVKVLPDRVAADAEALARFEREAKAVAAVTHPNVLAIHDFGTDHDVTYIVTELLEGETLRERLHRSAIPWRKAVEIGASVADGLASAHANGIIHRDLKPENIFLTTDGVTKILDFGLARSQRPSAPDDRTLTLDTKPGTVLGTLNYMSPEQVRGQPLDARTDIFSLGCVLYEMITGERVFKGKTSADVTTAILTQDPATLSTTILDVVPDLDRTIGRCLEKKPQQRFQSSGDLAFTLRSIHADSGAVAVARPARPFLGLGIPVACAALLLVGAVGYLGYRAWSGRETWKGGARSGALTTKGALDRTAPLPAERTARMRVAILPFDDTSPKPQEWFANGMTEAAIDDLAKISGLHVISHTSVKQYRGTRESVPAIAKALNVDFIVAGSVLRDGDRVRIRARLLEGSTDEQIWSQSYERSMADIIALQHDVAKAIVEGIEVTLTPSEQAHLAQTPRVNADAYQLYMIGMNFVRDGTKADCESALKLFDQALEMDPNFALAHVGKANAYYILSSDHLPPKEVMPKLRDAALEALRMDNNLADAHVAMGKYKLEYEWDFEGASEAFEKAIKASPNSANAHLGYAVYLSAMDRGDEALRQLDLVQEYNPASRHTDFDYGAVSYMAHDYERTIRDSEAAIAIDPNWYAAHLWMGLASSQLGRHEEAVAHAREGARLSGSPTWQAMAGGVLAVAGRREEAMEIYKSLKDVEANTYICPYELATIPLGLGDHDTTFKEMDRACEARADCLAWLQADPRLDPIRPDPRFDRLLSLVGFKPRGGLTVAESPSGERSLLAVLPFSDLSSKPQEWFVDGITEAVNFDLAQISGLRVISHTSVRKYKDTRESIPSIGEQLGVTHVVLGSIIRDAERMQIRVRVIEADTEQQVWAERFSRSSRDVLAIQNDVARAIAKGVRVTLTPQDEARLSSAQRVEPEAHEAFMLGMSFVRQATRKSCNTALKLFDRAIEIDPQFALAHVGRAAAYYVLSSNHIPPKDAMPFSRQAALRALELDDTLAEAHVYLGYYQLQFKYDWEGARKAFEFALDLNPSLSTARIGYAMYLTAMNRGDEAIGQLDIVQELDPSSHYTNMRHGLISFMARRFDRSIQDALAALEVDPQWWVAHARLAMAYSQKGQHDKAVYHAQKVILLNDSPKFRAVAGGVLASAGLREDALSIYNELKANEDEAYVCPYELATIHIPLGNYDTVFDEMNRACDARADCIPWLQADPRLDPIRPDPRFDRLLTRAGFVPKGVRLAVVEPNLATLAVLPFEPATANSETEYLKGEIPASIIHTLSALSDLKVIPRSTAFRFQVGDRDTAAIGRELGATAVLTGQINTRGDTLIIRAELVDVATNSQLWDGRYNRKLADIMAIEEDIAKEISGALRLQLTGEERVKLAKRYTENAEAYQHYLKARFWWNKRTQSGFNKAIALYDEAIDVDPNYALAYAGKADCYCLAGWYSRPALEVVPKVMEAVDAALALNPQLPEAYPPRAWVRAFVVWDWAGAERDFRRAIKLNPNYATAHHWYSIFLAAQGRLEESRREIKRALELDPGSLIINRDLGGHYFFRRQYDLAIEQYRITLGMDPTFATARAALASVLMADHQYDEAIVEIKRAYEEVGRLPRTAGVLAATYAAAGHLELAREELKTLTALSEKQYVPAVIFALIHAELGEHDAAFVRMDEAFEARDGSLVFLAVSPWFDALRPDPRFDDLSHRVGLPPSASNQSSSPSARPE